MRGFLSTAIVWGIALIIVNPRGVKGFLRTGTVKLTREQVAITLALLGTHTFAATSAEEILTNPTTMERVARGSLAAAALLIVAPAVIRRMRVRSGVRWRAMSALTLYFGVGLLSVLYSVAVLVSAGKVFELGAGLAIVWAIALLPNPIDQLKKHLRFLLALEAALVIGAIVGFFAIPSFFARSDARPGFLLDKTMGAPYAHSNSLSASASLIAAFGLAQALTSEDRATRNRWLGLFGISTVGLILASGRQGVVIWIAAVAILLWVHRRRLFLMLLGPSVAGLGVVYWDVLAEIFVRGSAGNTANLSGRLIWWQAALEPWAQHPWTGYGFGAGGRFVALASIGRVSTSSLHSGYMEALVGVGLLGLIPLAYAVWRAALWSLRALRARALTPFAILIVPLALHTSASLGFGAWLTADFLLFGMVVAMADVFRARAPTPEQMGVPAVIG